MYEKKVCRIFHNNDGAPINIKSSDGGREPGGLGNKKSFTDLNGIQSLVLLSTLRVGCWLYFFYCSIDEYPHTRIHVPLLIATYVYKEKAYSVFCYLFPPDIVPFWWRKRDILLHTKRKKLQWEDGKKATAKATTTTNPKKRWKECVPYMCEKELSEFDFDCDVKISRKNQERNNGRERVRKSGMQLTTVTNVTRLDQLCCYI